MATLEKTYFYSEKFPNVKYKKLGKTKFQVSACGFGTYRVDQSIPDHHNALEYALLKGINVIDTASNYALGGSEVLIGNTLNKLINEKKIDRDEIVIVTKGGYIQGDALIEARNRENDGIPFQDIVKCEDDLWHCIHPEFLETQIARSIKRLDVDKIDVYLLHNPEYFLTHTNSDDIQEIRTQFYHRIKNAFIFLEKMVVDGAIDYYGVSSNTMINRENTHDFVSLETLYAIANEIQPNNHFAVIEIPMNIIEKNAYNLINQTKSDMSVLEFASSKNLGVLINRPLNSLIGNKLKRISEFKIKQSQTYEEIQLLIEDLTVEEDNIRNNFVERSNIDKSVKKIISECFTLSKVLSPNYNQFLSIEQFKEIKNYFLVPRANFAINELYKHYSGDLEINDKLDQYAVNINLILDSIESLLAVEHNFKCKKINMLLNKYVSDELQLRLKLSQKAVAFINSLENVSVTLVGMRKIKYVDDMLESLSVPFINTPEEFWASEVIISL